MARSSQAACQAFLTLRRRGQAGGAALRGAAIDRRGAQPAHVQRQARVARLICRAHCAAVPAHESQNLGGDFFLPFLLARSDPRARIVTSGCAEAVGSSRRKNPTAPPKMGSPSLNSTSAGLSQFASLSRVSIISPSPGMPALIGTSDGNTAAPGFVTVVGIGRVVGGDNFGRQRIRCDCLAQSSARPACPCRLSG